MDKQRSEMKAACPETEEANHERNRGGGRDPRQVWGVDGIVEAFIKDQKKTADIGRRCPAEGEAHTSTVHQHLKPKRLMKTFFKFISLFLSSCQHIIQQILYIQCFLSLNMLYLSYANENLPCQKKKKNILHS